MIAERSKRDAFDSVAPTFERHRALPDGAPEAIRAAVLGAVDASSPRLLDLGAGTGRIGIPFVAAGDDYVGVDLSFGMLGAFAQRGGGGRAPRLVQADGEHLPFRDATFDAVMLIQVFGGMRGWRRLLVEARRVLRGSRRAGARPHACAARRPRRADEGAAGAAARRDRRAGRSDQHAAGRARLARAGRARQRASLRRHGRPAARRADSSSAMAAARGFPRCRRRSRRRRCAGSPTGRTRRSARSMQHRPSRTNSSCSYSGFHEGDASG